MLWAAFEINSCLDTKIRNNVFKDVFAVNQYGSGQALQVFSIAIDFEWSFTITNNTFMNNNGGLVVYTGTNKVTGYGPDGYTTRESSASRTPSLPRSPTTRLSTTPSSR